MDIPTCLICFSAYTEIKNPVCTACGLIMCSMCADNNNKYSNKCPKCRCLMDGHMVAPEICNIILEKELEEKYKCFDCKEIFEYKKILDHMKNNCAYRRIKCKHCNDNMILKELESHMKICCNRMIEFVECKNCNENIISKELESHMKICHKMIKCDKCKKNIQAHSLKPHVDAGWCRCNNNVQCPQCGDIILADELDLHISYICRAILVDCSQRCGQKVKITRLENHMKNICINRHRYK